jgi:hypothetical protein
MDQEQLLQAILSELKDQSKSQKSALDKAKDKHENIKDPTKQSQAIARDAHKAIVEEQKALQARKDALDNLTPAEERHLDNLASQRQALGELAGAHNGTTDEIKKADAAYKDLLKTQDEVEKSLVTGAAKAETMQDSIFGLTSEASKLKEVLPKDSVELKKMATEMFKGAGPAKLLSSFIEKIAFESLALAFAADSAAAAFQRQTGAADGHKSTLSGIRSETAIMGASYKQAAMAVGSLYTEMSSFTTLSKQTKKELGKQAVLLDAFGVSTSQTAQMFDQATKSLGMTEDQLVGLTEDIHSTAQSLGKSTAEVFADFTSVSKQLAFYGEDVIDVFQELEKQSKATGIEVDKLVGISGKAFDTFDGAATKVGRLNAILGGPYLNSIDMLNATESERLEMLTNSIDQSGKLYSDMSKFEQLAIADALGVDVDTARRMFGELSAAEELQIKQKEKLAETARSAQAVFAKFTNAVMSLVVALDPLISFFAWIVEGVSSIINWFGKLTVEINDQEYAWGKYLVTGTALILMFKKIGIASKAIGLIATPFKAAGKAMGGLFGGGGGGAAAGGGMIAKIKSFLLAIKGSAKELVALGLAVAGIGAGIYLAATGLAELVKAFDGITNAGMALGAIIAVMAGFAIILGITAAVGAAAAGPMLAVGAGLFLVGAGVSIAARGMAVFAQSLKGIGPDITLIAAAITEVIKAVISLSLVFPALALTATAFATLAASLTLFAGAVLLLNRKKLEALTEFNYSAVLTVENTTSPSVEPSKRAMAATEDRMAGAPATQRTTSGGRYSKPTINFHENAIIVKIGETELKTLITKTNEENIAAFGNA